MYVDVDKFKDRFRKTNFILDTDLDDGEMHGFMIGYKQCMDKVFEMMEAMKEDVERR